ncbi:uncharacterized protein LOC142320030 [Lycorma delicatula]|uniref:uncharacterized protein LOC142320030 n=1 Tax=Lycorma delicatula TaxID=130591 RepID=UPI003F5165CF
MVGLESQQCNLCKVLLLLYVFCSCTYINQVCPAAVKTGYYHARGNPPGTEIQKTSTKSESKMMHEDINEINRNGNGAINLKIIQPHDRLKIKYQEMNKSKELISNSNKSNHNNFMLKEINNKSENKSNLNQLNRKYKTSNQQRKKRCVKNKLSSKKLTNESSSKLQNTPPPPCCDSLNKLLSETLKLQSTCKCSQSFELTKLNNKLQQTAKSNKNNIVKLRKNNNDAYGINNLESNADDLEIMKKDEQDLEHINHSSKPEYYMNHINLNNKYMGIKPNNQYIIERKNNFNKLGDQIKDIITESSVNKENVQTKRDFSYETTENEYKVNNEINVIKENNPKIENYFDLTDYENPNVNDRDNTGNLKDNEKPQTLNNNINYPISKQEKSMYPHKAKSNDISSNGKFYQLQFNKNISPRFKITNDRINSFLSDYDNKQRMEDKSNDYSTIDEINMIQENGSKKENYINSDEDKSVINEDSEGTMKEYNNKTWDLNKNENYPVISKQDEEIHSTDAEYNDNNFSKDHSNIFNDYENNSPFAKISNENIENTFVSNYNNANNKEQKMNDDSIQNNNYYSFKKESLLPLKYSDFSNIKKLILEKKKQVVEETTLNAKLENNINLIYHDLNKEKTSLIKQTISKDNNEMQSNHYVMQPNENDKSTNIESIDANNSDEYNDDSRRKIQEKLNINTKQDKSVYTEDSYGRLSQEKDAEVVNNNEYVTEDDEMPVILDSENYSQENKLYNNDEYEKNSKTNNELHESIHQGNKLINQNNNNIDKSLEKYDETIEKYNDNISYEERQLDEQTGKAGQNQLPEENKTQTNVDKFNNYNDTDYTYSQLDDNQLNKVNDNDIYDWNESNNYNYSTYNDNNEHELNNIKQNDPNKIISEINEAALSTDINPFVFITTNKNENVHNIKSIENRNESLNSRFSDDNTSFTEKVKSESPTLKDANEKITNNIIQENITTKSFKNNNENNTYFNKDVTSNYGVTLSTDENNLKNTDESINESDIINTEKVPSSLADIYINETKTVADKQLQDEELSEFRSKYQTENDNIPNEKIIELPTPTGSAELQYKISKDNYFTTSSFFMEENQPTINILNDIQSKSNFENASRSNKERNNKLNKINTDINNYNDNERGFVGSDIHIIHNYDDSITQSITDESHYKDDVQIEEKIKDTLGKIETIPTKFSKMISKTSTSKQLGNNNYISFTDEPSLEFTKTYDKITIVPHENSKINFNIANKNTLPDYIEENKPKSIHDDYVTDENEGITLSQFISNELIPTNNPTKETSPSLITETKKRTNNLIFSNFSPTEYNYPITRYKYLSKINDNDSRTDEINKESTIMNSRSSNVHENLLKPDDTTFYDSKELKKNIYENIDHTNDQFINTDITAAMIHDDTTYDTSTTLNDFRKITPPNEITNTENKYLRNSDFTGQTYVAVSKESEKISYEHHSKISENYNDENKYNNYENNSKNKLNPDVTKYESKSISESTPIITETYNDRVFLSKYTGQPEMDDNYTEPSEYIKVKQYPNTTMKIFPSNYFKIKENEIDDSKISKNIIADNIGVTMHDDIYKSLNDDKKITTNSKIESTEDKYSEIPDFIGNKHLVERNRSEIISNKLQSKTSEDYNNDYDNSNNNENNTKNKLNPFTSKDESKSTSESTFIVSNVRTDQNKIENTKQPEIYGDIYVESNKYTTDKNKHISMEQPSLNNNKIINDTIDNENIEIENTVVIKHDDASKTTNYFTEQIYGAGSYESETPLNKDQSKLSESNQISISNDKNYIEDIVHSDISREFTKLTSSSLPLTDYLSSNKKMLLIKNYTQSDNIINNYNNLNLYTTEKYNTDFTDVIMKTSSPNHNKNTENEIVASKIDKTIKTDQGKTIEQYDIGYDTSTNLNDYRNIISNEIVNTENKYTEIPNFIEQTDRGKSKELEDILNKKQSKSSKISNDNNLHTDKYTSYTDNFEKEIEINNFIENNVKTSATPLPLKLISSTHLKQKWQEIESTNESTENLSTDNPIIIPFSEKSVDNIFNNANASEQKKSSITNENLKHEFSTINDNYQTTNIPENGIQNNILSNSMSNDKYNLSNSIISDEYSISKHDEKNNEETSQYPEDFHSNYISKNEIEKLTTAKEFDKKKINELNFINNYDENIKELYDDNDNKINFKISNNYPSQTTTKENLDFLNKEINSIYTTLTPEYNDLDFNRKVIDENISTGNSPLTVTKHEDQSFTKPASEMSSDFEKKFLEEINIQNTTRDDKNITAELNSNINSGNKQIFISNPSLETEKDLRINKLPTTLPINYANNTNFNNNIDDNYVVSKLNKLDELHSVSNDSVVPLYKQEKHFFTENYDSEGIQLFEKTGDNQLNSNELISIPKEGFPAVISVPVWITINDSSLVSSPGSKFYVENNGEKTELTVKKTAKPLMLSISPHYLLTNNLNDDTNNRGGTVPVKSSIYKRTNKNNMKIDLLEPPPNSKDDFLNESKKNNSSSDNKSIYFFIIPVEKHSNLYEIENSTLVPISLNNKQFNSLNKDELLNENDKYDRYDSTNKMIKNDNLIDLSDKSINTIKPTQSNTNLKYKKEDLMSKYSAKVDKDVNDEFLNVYHKNNNEENTNADSLSPKDVTYSQMKRSLYDNMSQWFHNEKLKRIKNEKVIDPNMNVIEAVYTSVKKLKDIFQN